MTINGDDVMEASLLRPIEDQSEPSLTPEEEATLLGEGDGPSGAPSIAPLQAEISRFIEPAKWNTFPVTSTAHHCHPSLKREKSRKELMSIPTELASGSMLTWKGLASSQSGWKNFGL